MNSTDIEYVLHCIKNASELINQSKSEKQRVYFNRLNCFYQKNLHPTTADTQN